MGPLSNSAWEPNTIFHHLLQFLPAMPTFHLCIASLLAVKKLDLHANRKLKRRQWLPQNKKQVTAPKLEVFTLCLVGYIRINCYGSLKYARTITANYYCYQRIHYIESSLLCKQEISYFLAWRCKDTLCKTNPRNKKNR